MFLLARLLAFLWSMNVINISSCHAKIGGSKSKVRLKFIALSRGVVFHLDMLQFSSLLYQDLVRKHNAETTAVYAQYIQVFR